MPAPGPDYWALLDAYHCVREGLYRRIIAEAFRRPAREMLILDAGCGDAFYSRLLAEAWRPPARIVAADRNPVGLRVDVAEDPPGAIHHCLTDLEQAGLQCGVFDAIWLCRAMHSALDPLRRLAALVPLLRPGGQLIVIENDFAHYPILSFPADFGHRILQAHHHYLASRCADGTSLERYHAARHLPTWLAQVGLESVCTHTYIAEDVAPMGSDAEQYWRLFMGWLGCRIWPFLSPDDQHTYVNAFDPESRDYVLNHPGFYCLELTTVACGAAPA
jgi:SAM-dependent methyltransferase